MRDGRELSPPASLETMGFALDGMAAYRDWQSYLRDDGALVLYCGADAADDEGDSATAVHRVRPVGGRLVLFDSRTVLHEVRPHGRRDDRFALTLWLGGEHYPEFRCLRPYVS